MDSLPRTSSEVPATLTAAPPAETCLTERTVHSSLRMTTRAPGQVDGARKTCVFRRSLTTGHSLAVAWLPASSSDRRLRSYYRFHCGENLFVVVETDRRRDVALRVFVEEEIGRGGLNELLMLDRS